MYSSLFIIITHTQFSLFVFIMRTWNYTSQYSYLHLSTYSLTQQTLKFRQVKFYDNSDTVFCFVSFEYRLSNVSNYIMKFLKNRKYFFKCHHKCTRKKKHNLYWLMEIYWITSIYDCSSCPRILQKRWMTWYLFHKGDSILQMNLLK